ncbi:hypothetical protein ONZ45_g11815 [Pleurotus djamor]|nr:hypothetical protein ONZ45_g11815 [Pleurotus djamor]
MANLLTIPLKKSYEVDIQGPVRNYIQQHCAAHPNEFRRDIEAWQRLRRQYISGIIHIDSVDVALLYHAQLVCMLAKLPVDIGLAIPYAHAFAAPNTLPVTLNNLAFERASVLFNLAALHSKLAAVEDRSNQDGLKRAINHYKNAAGTLSYLINKVLPTLRYDPEDDVPPDLSENFLKSLEHHMKAQAEECAWQNAKLGTVYTCIRSIATDVLLQASVKNPLMARLAQKTASEYEQAVDVISNSSSETRGAFPSYWIAHLEAKRSHFFAVAQYRKSIDANAASQYGVELARLGLAQIHAKTAYDRARRGGVMQTVVQDAKSLLDTVLKDITRAERDNDYIYHQDVPAHAALPEIVIASLIQSFEPPTGLTQIHTLIPDDQVLFKDLIGWAAREAISIYDDRKRNLIEEKLVGASRDMDEVVSRVLHELNLPASLEALERPIGLPPSLLKKAEEVRLENGPATIEASIEDVQRLARQDMDILNEALDILDEEASEDEAARKEQPLPRAPSHEANMLLTEKASRYRNILDEASRSDEIVREKWDEWEQNIVELTWDQADLEAAVPSSTIQTTGRLSAASPPTQVNARKLRALLDDVEAIKRSRAGIVERAMNTAEADEEVVRNRIVTASAGFSKWADMKPAMFEDQLDEELAKYDRYITEMTETEKRQEELLNDIRTRNTVFMQSRRDDPSVKERELALQSLDLSYHKYREIRRNLEEGFKFYNDLASILLQFKESCKHWTTQRKQEIHKPSAQYITLAEGHPTAAPSFAKRALNETNKGITTVSLAHDGQSYFSVLEVGGINFRVALDTASSDLWLASSGCVTPTCEAVPPYPLTYDSPTFASVNNNQTAFNASYADDTFANGFVARERVTLANLTIPDQAFGVITESNVSLTDRSSGLLGLGFPRLSGINETVTNSTPFFANLAQRGLLEYPLFGVRLTKNNSGSLSLGAIDASVVMEPNNISWNPVVQFSPFATENNVSSYLQWAIPLEAFSINDTLLAPMPTYTNVTNNMSIALIDVGTSGIYGPIQDVTRFFSEIPGARLVEPWQWAIPCDTAIPISFTFGQHAFSLDPSDYIIGPASGNPNLCLSWPMASPPNSDGIDWQFGTNFLRTVYSVYSYGINLREPPMIGFYPLRNQTSPEQLPTDVISSIISVVSGITTIQTTLPNFPLPTPTFSTPTFTFNTSIPTTNGGIVATALATSTYSPIFGGGLDNLNASAIPTISPAVQLQTFILTNAQGLVTTSVSTAVEPTVTLGLPGFNGARRVGMNSAFGVISVFAVSSMLLCIL